jgi:hypothetical protein
VTKTKQHKQNGLKRVAREKELVRTHLSAASVFSSADIAATVCRRDPDGLASPPDADVAARRRELLGLLLGDEPGFTSPVHALQMRSSFPYAGWYRR